MDMTINENILRLSGKVSIPEPLEIGYDYQIAIKGQITGRSEDDNHDGSHNLTFKFEPLSVEILTPQGKTLKSKDKQKMSQKLRSRIYLAYQDSQTQDDFDIFYQKTMNYLMSNLDLILTIPLK